MSSTRAFGMMAPSESATVPRTVAACAANPNSLERRSKRRSLAHGRFCLKYFIFPLGNWCRQNRSPDSRFDESGQPSQGFSPQWLQSPACPVSRRLQLRGSGGFSPRFPNILPFRFCSKSPRSQAHCLRIRLRDEIVSLSPPIHRMRSGSDTGSARRCNRRGPREPLSSVPNQDVSSIPQAYCSIRS
jgi:hypothetical protein